MFSRAARRRQEGLQNSASSLYGRIVAQARRPEFYQHWGVPDSVDGRFDLIVLHVFLVLRRLKADGEPAEELAQGLFDTLFLDMDQSLREMGAGDLGVGKRVKRMVQAFYGRVEAYEAGLAEGEAALQEALRRNLYGTAAPEPRQLAALASYLQRESRALVAQASSDLAAGRLEFGAPPAVEAAPS